MPRQNRVTPLGEIVACAERGTLMGNRGILHNAAGQLTDRRWTTQAWIICLLTFQGRRRPIMSPGTYTELFFLDEATALAAGHRPCGECRRSHYRHFKACWAVGNGEPEVTIHALDRQLHRERVTRSREKIVWECAMSALPDGTFVRLDGALWLLWQEALYRWFPGGYDQVRSVPRRQTVTVITPRSTVHALAAGYVPQHHPSVHELHRHVGIDTSTL